MKDEFLSLAGGVTVLRAHDYASGPVSQPVPRIGIISNPRSHRNTGEVRLTALPPAMLFKHEPQSRDQLREILAQFAAANVELIVIEGGDGTIRDVLSAAHSVYRGRLPRMAVIPAGKTNALAADLGIPTSWSLADAVASFTAGQFEERSPVHVRWTNGSIPDQLGFIFGLGAFNRATTLAQQVHKRGGFGNLAVVVTLIAGLFQSIFGGPRSSWRRGDLVQASRDGVEIFTGRVFLMLASTLRSLPAGLAPFGPPRDGLKILSVKAPPKRLYRHVFGILRGKESPEFERDGFIRRDVERVTLKIRKGIIIDGDRFPGGHLAISQGAPIAFAVPR